MSDIVADLKHLLGYGEQPDEQSVPLNKMREKMQARFDADLRRDIQLQVQETEGEFERNLIVSISKINQDVCSAAIDKMSSKDLGIILKAAEHPAYNVAKLLIGEPGSLLDKGRMEYIRRVSMYFSLFRDAEVNESSYAGALHCLTVISGVRDIAVLRREPEGYLKALLTIYKEMPMELALSGAMHTKVQQMLKEEPGIVDTLIAYCAQRNMGLEKVDPAAFCEALASPAAPLRGGVL